MHFEDVRGSNRVIVDLKVYFRANIKIIAIFFTNFLLDFLILVNVVAVEWTFRVELSINLSS